MLRRLFWVTVNHSLNPQALTQHTLYPHFTSSSFYFNSLHEWIHIWFVKKNIPGKKKSCCHISDCTPFVAITHHMRLPWQPQVLSWQCREWSIICGIGMLLVSTWDWIYFVRIINARHQPIKSIGLNIFYSLYAKRSRDCNSVTLHSRNIVIHCTKDMQTHSHTYIRPWMMLTPYCW